MAAFAVADALLFKFLPDVTICYKCYAQYRQVTPNPDNQPFELGLAEKWTRSTNVSTPRIPQRNGRAAKK